MENNKQPEASLILRYADAEHLLKSLKLLPDQDKKSVTHQDLVKRLTVIRDHWLKLEKTRKTRMKTVLRNKIRK